MKHADALAALDLLAAAHVSRPAAAIYLDLIIRTDDNGLCWPSTARLAADLHVLTANIRRWLPELEAAELAVVERFPGRVNLYRLPTDVVHTPRGGARRT